jgi:hypothetical protein
VLVIDEVTTLTDTTCASYLLRVPEYSYLKEDLARSVLATHICP